MTHLSHGSATEETGVSDQAHLDLLVNVARDADHVLQPYRDYVDAPRGHSEGLDKSAAPEEHQAANANLQKWQSYLKKRARYFNKRMSCAYRKPAYDFHPVKGSKWDPNAANQHGEDI